MSLDKKNGIDEGVEKPKSNGVDVKAQFLRDFKNDIAGKEESDRIALFDKIKKADSIDSSLKEELNKNFNYSAEMQQIKEGNKYPGLDLNTISITDLKKFFSSDIISIENDRKSLKALIFNDYEIDEEEYSCSILPEIQKLTPSKILEFKKSLKKRDEFLLSVLGKDKLPLSKGKVSFFEQISGLKEKVLDQNLENRDKLEDILQRLHCREKSTKLGSIDIGALTDLFNLDFLENGFKKQIINDFLPVISFKDARAAGIVFDEKEQKEEIIKETFSKEEIVNLGLEDLVGKLNDEYIYLETDKLLSDENISKISKNTLLSSNIAQNFGDYFNKSLDKIIEETKNNGPQTIKSLSTELGKIDKEGKFNYLENFSEGNIMKVSKKIENADTKVSYIKILKADDDKRELTFLEVGEGKIVNLNKDGEGKNISYFELFENFKKGAIKLDFFTVKDIEKQIKDPSNTELESSDLDFFTESDINNASDEQKEKFKTYYRENAEKDLLKLKDELDQSDGKEDENSLLKSRINDLEEEIKNIDSLDDVKLLEFLNFRKLLDKIDNIDPDGKSLGLKKGVIIKTKDWSYEIEGINEENQIITLNSASGIENISFEAFYQGFKEKDSKRIEKINDFGEFLKDFENSDIKGWKDHEFKDDSLFAKGVENGDEKGDQKVEYFVSDKEDSIIKIDNISGDKITVQFGERKSKSSLDKKDKNYSKDDEGEVLYINGADKQTFTLNEFQNIISDKKYGYRPSWETAKEIKTKQSEDLKNKIEGNGVTRFFDRISISEIIAGGKMFIEGIEETMKKGNDLHAAKVALAMGSILPDEIRAELQIKVERTEAEQMDKELENLGKVDSGDAVSRIKSWLLNKDTPEFKKEAGLMFMISKYGVLYAKGPLGGMKGSFLWYEAFGGRINDPLYLKVKSDAENGEPPIPFTEEALMFAMLSDQCKKREYFPHIKRRGRLYKDYEGKIKQGIEDELAKGSKEAISMRSFKDRNEGAKGEFKGGEFNNAIGKYKEAINRGSSISDMNDFPFTILFSGGCYLMQQEQLNEFKAFTEGGMKFGGLLFTKFLTDTDGMKVFSETILTLSEKFEEKDPEHFKGMLDRAEIIFNNQNNSKLSLRNKMNEAESFWAKYGEALSRTMLNLNDQDSTYTKTDKILLTEKKDLSNYNNTIEGYMSGATFSSEDNMNDQFKNQGISGLGYKVFDEIGGLSADSRFRNNEAAESILNEMTGEIYITKNNIYSDDKIENYNIKLLNIERQLSFIFTYIKKNGGQSNTMRNMIEGSSYWGDFKKLGISNHIKRLHGDEFNIMNLSKLNTKEVQSFMKSVAKDILSGNTGTNNSNSSNNLFDEIISSTKGTTSDTIS